MECIVTLRKDRKQEKENNKRKQRQATEKGGNEGENEKRDDGKRKNKGRIPSGSSLPHTAVRVTKAEKNDRNVH